MINSPILNAASEHLDFTFTPGAGDSPIAEWLVVLGHGVTGDKTRPIIADTAAALNAAGFSTLAISFAGNGDSEGDFRACTITKEVADLGGVLRAAQDERIRALVSLAGMVDTKTFAETEFGDVKADEGVMWEDEDCPLSSTFMTDLTATVGNVSPAAEQVAIPWLLVHGTADDVVLPADTEHIQVLKQTYADYVFVEGADHGFNEPAHKNAATSAVTDWLCKQAS